ncbi:MAG: hypothetical protein GY719_10855 [bacterium]|nr:hypothetical protein [bacterium]
MRYAPLLPFLLTFALIFRRFAINPTEVRLGDFLAMVLSYSFICLLIYAPLQLLTRDRVKSSLIATAAVYLNFTNGLVVHFLKAFDLDGSGVGTYRYVALGLACITGLAIGYLVLKSTELEFAALFSWFLVLLLLAHPSIILISGGADFFSSPPSDSNPPTETESSPSSDGANDRTAEIPDVYFIILDAYMGHGPLREYFKFDNSSFLRQLDERGFHVLGDSRSNYQQTIASIPATLNMEYLPKDPIADFELWRLIQRNKVVEVFAELGHEIHIVAPSTGNRMDLVTHHYESFFEVNEFIVATLRDSYAGELLYRSSYLKRRGSDRVLRIFDVLRDIASRGSGAPAFAYGHVPIPHPPYYFKADGDLHRVVSMNWRVSGSDEKYIDQLEFTNHRTLALVDSMLEREPPPVIILQGDHGHQSVAEDTSPESFADPSRAQVEQWTSNLSAFYFPDGDYSLLYDSMTSVNTFRVVFKKYLDPSMELRDDVSHFVEYEKKGPHTYVKTVDIARYAINSAPQ